MCWFLLQFLLLTTSVCNFFIYHLSRTFFLWEAQMWHIALSDLIWCFRQGAFPINIYRIGFYQLVVNTRHKCLPICVDGSAHYTRSVISSVSVGRYEFEVQVWINLRWAFLLLTAADLWCTKCAKLFSLAISPLGADLAQVLRGLLALAVFPGSLVEHLASLSRMWHCPMGFTLASQPHSL